MPNYPALAQTVARLINDFGSRGQAQVTRRIPGAYDPITDTDAGETTQVFEIDVTVLPVSQKDIGTKFDDLAQTDSVKLYFPAEGSPTQPEVADKVALPNRDGLWNITDIKKTAPDGLPLLYVCIAEKTTDQ